MTEQLYSIFTLFIYEIQTGNKNKEDDSLCRLKNSRFRIESTLFIGLCVLLTWNMSNDKGIASHSGHS